MNINAIVDFQRRFLIRFEQTYTMTSDLWQWGRIFTQNEEHFAVYDTYLANVEAAMQSIEVNIDKLRMTEHPLSTLGPKDLCGFCIKPMQRITKYLLLLKVKALIVSRSE